MLNADNILLPCTSEELAARRQKKVDRFEKLWPGVLEKTKEWMKGKYFRKLWKECHLQHKMPRRHSGHVYLCAPPAVRGEIGGHIGIMSWALVCDEWFNMITDMADQLWTEAILDEC